MKYCYTCRAFRQSNAWYCRRCGCSFMVRLCHRQHLNPRTAEYCEVCGSAELSSPDRLPPLRAVFAGLGVISAMGVAALAFGWMLWWTGIDFFGAYPKLLGITIFAVGTLGGGRLLWSALGREDLNDPPMPPPPSPPRQEVEE